MSDLIPDKPKKAGKPAVPRPSSTCMVDGCNNDTEVVVMRVRNIATNKQYADRPGRFVFMNKNEWNMKDGYRFEDYVTRCGGCYAYDVERYQGNKVQTQRRESGISEQASDMGSY